VSPVYQSGDGGMSTKPMLAEDLVEDKLVFPCGVQPKIDGVRGCNLDGWLTGRSLKAHKNRYTTNYYSGEHYFGLDGELAAEQECHPDLCRITTSAVGTIMGEPYTVWHCFDYITEDTISLPYGERYIALMNKVQSLNNPHIKLVPMFVVNNLQELLAYESMWLDMGYEGLIKRDLNGKFKQGRSTVKEGGLLRLKRFIEEEGEVVGIVEGEINGNEAQTNELGKTFRSSRKENMVPNGMVGTLKVRSLKQVLDRDGSVLIEKDQIVTVSAGSMKHPERIYYMRNPDQLLRKIIKFKFFPKGMKDEPRFPTFKSIKIESDL
jgi:DNA ligase-1